MSQPPIVPGPDEPPPVPYYPQQPYYPPPQAGPLKPTDTVGRTVVGTITVVGVLFLIFCVAPLFLCVACGTLGSISGG